MSDPLPDEKARALAEVAHDHPGLDLLVLHGSRARGDGGERSDWDFGFLARSPIDVAGLIAGLAGVVGSDRVDVADLDRSSALLRYRAARDGVAVFERKPGAFARFWLDAVRFWCDAGPVLRSGYDEILARLDR